MQKNKIYLTVLLGKFAMFEHKGPYGDSIVYCFVFVLLHLYAKLR